MLKWQVGKVKITQLVELTTASLGPYLLPQATPEALAALPWLEPFVGEEKRIVLSIHSGPTASLLQSDRPWTALAGGRVRYVVWTMRSG